jgi:hypothetical protein
MIVGVSYAIAFSCAAQSTQHSYMKGFAIFCICNFIFSCTGNRGKTKIRYLFGLFLVLLFSVRMVVESVKESQGGKCIRAFIYRPMAKYSVYINWTIFCVYCSKEV